MLSLINIKAVCCLYSIPQVFASFEILGSEIVSVAEQAYLSLTCLQTGRQVFSWIGLYRLPNL